MATVPQNSTPNTFTLDHNVTARLRHLGVFCPKRRKGIFQRASPFLLIFFDDMRVSEIQIDGRGGQPVMPEDFLNRRQ